MTRAVVTVATTDRYQRGQLRLWGSLVNYNDHKTDIFLWGKAPHWVIPATWPTHGDKPYAFKAYALQAARGHDLILWADASILPVRSMEPLWERIERDGYWFSKSGYSNYEWTAESAYPDLFAVEMFSLELGAYIHSENAKTINRTIDHVAATAFGLNMRHPKGQAFLTEYFRLASETRAFCGPWTNTPETPCGPADVRGHRHDQTAASVIAWRLGFKLTDPPNIFAYPSQERPMGAEDTILLAEGSYA